MLGGRRRLRPLPPESTVFFVSVDELKRELEGLSDRERSEVTAFLFHLRHRSDEKCQAVVGQRMDDKDPSHWLSPEQFESRMAED